MSGQDQYWVWLSSIEGMGAVTFYKILGVYLDAKTACENLNEIPSRLKLNVRLAQNIRSAVHSTYIEHLLESIEKAGVKVLTRINQDYPQTLEEIDNPPPVLYFKGDMLPPVDEKSCGIVGSRRPTKHGYEMARQFATEFSANGVTVVSGMARGIDTAAHLGALDANGKTIAVLGCGADVVYPPENRKLYDAIVERGAIVSEFLPGTPPKPTYFPQRNRVISGLAKLLVCGEGNEKSGARITVDHALKQGREVYVLPCNMQSTMAKLPLFLVDAGAPMARKASEIMEDQGWAYSFVGKTDAYGRSELGVDEALVMNALLRENMTADELAFEIGKDVQQMNMLLTVMELTGMIEACAGGKFRAIHK